MASKSKKSKPSGSAVDATSIGIGRPGVSFNLLALLIPVLLFALLEGGARLVLWNQVDFDPDAYRTRRYQLSSQVGYFYGKTDQHQVFNDYGLKKSRWSELVPWRNPDKKQFRVLVLGGSGVAGSERQVGADWPTYTEQLLRQGNPDLDVLVSNGGVWSGTSAFERMHMYHLRNYDWDLIVIYSGWNDLYSFSMKHEGYLADISRTNRRLGVVGRFWFGLKENSVFLSMLVSPYERQRVLQMGRAVDRFDARIPLNNTEKTMLLDAVATQLEPSLKIARQRQIPVLYLQQSSASYTRLFRPLDADEEQLLDAFMGVHKVYWTQIMSYFYPALAAQAKQLCSRYPNVTYLDFNSVTAPYHKLYYDDLHYRDEGMYVIGSKVAQLIQEKVLLRSLRGWVDFTPDNYEDLAANHGRPR